MNTTEIENADLGIGDWLAGEGADSKSVLLRVSFINPPSEKDLSEHAVVISYGEGTVVVEATRTGLRELLKVRGVLSASTPRQRQFAMI